MKKSIFIVCFLILLFLGLFYGQRIVTKNGESNQTIKDSLAYFYEKIGYFASIPYEDVKTMFQWGYKKLTRQPTSQSELIQARKAFLRTGVPVTLILAILGRVLYRKITIPKPLVEEDVEAPISAGKLEENGPPLDEPSLEDIPVPGTC